MADARRYKRARGEMADEEERDETEFLVRLRGAEERTAELLLEKEKSDREKDQLREQLRKVTEDSQFYKERLRTSWRSVRNYNCDPSWTNSAF